MVTFLFKASDLSASYAHSLCTSSKRALPSVFIVTRNSPSTAIAAKSRRTSSGSSDDDDNDDGGGDDVRLDKIQQNF